jgi:hypothetical protein
MQYYTYQHRSLDTNKIFYVGKGKSDRLNDKNKRSKYWKSYVAKHGFIAEKIVNNVDEEFAYFVEMEAIDVYKKRNIKLVNLSNGGEGCSAYLLFHSAKTKAKMSEAQKGNKNRLGKKASNETKEKIRIARLGKSLSESHKKAISKGLIGNKNTAKLTDEQIRFIRANKHTMTYIQLAEKFNIHKNMIHKIWRFESYKDVK